MFQIRTRRSQENQDTAGQSLENAGGDDHAPSLAAQLSRLQLHQPAEARQASTSSRANQDVAVIESELLPVAYSLIETESYKWLLMKLRSEILLVSPGDKILDVIRHNIIDRILMNHEEKHSIQIPLPEIIFSMDWDILGFLKEQKYPEHSDSIERVITITGTCDDGQALTLAQYLTQTWPSIGPIMLKMIKNVIAFGTDLVQMRKSPTIPPIQTANFSFLSTR